MAIAKNTLDTYFARVGLTDATHTKKVSGFGQSFTAIDNTYQTIQASKEFKGLFGSTWGIRGILLERERVNDDTSMVHCNAVFFHPTGEFEIIDAITYRSKTSKGKIVVDDDYAKKLQTSLISKGLARLGFNADVFMGQFDDNRYVQWAQQEIGRQNAVEYVAKLIEQSRTDMAKFMQTFSITELTQLDGENLTRAISMLEKKLLTQKKGATNGK